MIISHQYKFIFLKTEKTASTSLANFFVKAIGGKDVVLPATPAVKRKLLAEGRSLAEVSFYGQSREIKRHFPTLFGVHAHGKATDVRAFLGEELFSQYRIITSERNPWDRQVSLMAHRFGKRGMKLTPSLFQGSMASRGYNWFHHNRLRNWEIYSIDDGVCADRVIRFESLREDLFEVVSYLGLEPSETDLPHKRSGCRTAEYQEYYDEASREIVHAWYRKEILHFGYGF